MKKYFSVTYGVVTPESAEHGDYEESGFVLPGGWRYSVEELGEESPAMTLSEAIGLTGAGFEHGGGGTFYLADHWDENYTTGAREYRALHAPRNITRASLVRLCRVLGLKE